MSGLRTGARRVAFVVLAASFGAAGAADARGLHACPHHDRLPEASDPHSTARAHGVEADAGHAAGSPHEHEGPCTCVGGACSSGAVAAPAAGSAATLPAVAVGAGARGPHADAPPRPREPYLHPFANAPPVG